MAQVAAKGSPGAWPGTVREYMGNLWLQLSPDGSVSLGRGEWRILDEAYFAFRSEDWSTLALEIGEIRVHRTEHELTTQTAFRLPGAAHGTIHTRLSSHRFEFGVEFETSAELELARWGQNICLSADTWVGGASSSTTRMPLVQNVRPQIGRDGVRRGIHGPARQFIVAHPRHGRCVIDSDRPMEWEDQRNWTDPNFKIYAGSLADPIPQILPAGQRFQHVVSIEVFPPLQLPLPPRRRVAVDRRLSRIGVQFNDCVESISREDAIAALAGLSIDHVSVDVCGDMPLPPPGVELAREAGLDVHFAALEPDIRALGVRVASLLPMMTRRDRLYAHLERRRSTHAIRGFKILDDPRIVRGTDGYFVDINGSGRSRSHAVSFSLNPMVHVFSDRAIINTLTMQEQLVSQAAHQVAREVYVQPITLRRRGSPDLEHTAARRALIVPEDLDPRLATDVGAVWTLGSIYALARGRATSGTWHELVGPRGLIRMIDGEPFATPAYSAIAAIGGNRPYVHLIEGEDGAWRMIHFPDEDRIIIASMRPWEQLIRSRALRGRRIAATLSRSLVPLAESRAWLQRGRRRHDLRGSIAVPPFSVVHLGPAR